METIRCDGCGTPEDNTPNGTGFQHPTKTVRIHWRDGNQRFCAGCLLAKGFAISRAEVRRMQGLQALMDER